MTGTVLAIGAHPDDVEFMMAGTLLQLSAAGLEPHVFVIASGSCGSMTTAKDETVRIRLCESRQAAHTLGAQLHEPIVDDLEIAYTLPILRKVAAVIREVEPDIVLTHSPEEYMEDHNATCRLAVTAAFSRGMPNFTTEPERAPFFKDLVLYHCLPYGLADSMGVQACPDFFVDISNVLERKSDALACHLSQKLWLDSSQGLDSYLNAMKDMSYQVGEWSGRFKAAEGWRCHNHLGFCTPGSNPVAEILGDKYCLNR